MGRPREVGLKRVVGKMSMILNPEILLLHRSSDKCFIDQDKDDGLKKRTKKETNYKPKITVKPLSLHGWRVGTAHQILRSPWTPLKPETLAEGDKHRTGLGRPGRPGNLNLTEIDGFKGPDPRPNYHYLHFAIIPLWQRSSKRNH